MHKPRIKAHTRTFFKRRPTDVLRQQILNRHATSLPDSDGLRLGSGEGVSNGNDLDIVCLDIGPQRQRKTTEDKAVRGGTKHGQSGCEAVDTPCSKP
ncbi:hypothetical protein CsSME_00036104 [Camellia sinensis var. sinensis]